MPPDVRLVPGPPIPKAPVNSSSTSPARHRLLAIIASAALLLAGAAPAQATTTPLVVQGTVTFPAGYDPETARQPSMVLYPVGSSARATTARISPDGTFSARISSPAAGGYQLELDDYSEELREGWLTVDGSISTERSDSRIFTSSASVTVQPTLTATIRGTVVLPAGVNLDLSRLRIYAKRWTGTSWTSAGGAGGAQVRPNRTFTIFGLDAGTDYRLELDD